MQRLENGRTVAVLAALILATTACAPTTFYRSETLAHPDTSTDIVVLAPDIELSELSAGGVTEPKAQWTKQAREHVITALKENLQEVGTNTRLEPISKLP